MKRILRVITYTLISLSTAQFIINGLSFGSNEVRNFVLVLAALVMLTMFLSPLLALISLPNHGLGFTFIYMILTGILLFALSTFIPGYSLKASTLPGFSFFDIVLPAQVISPVTSALYTALTISLINNYLFWLNDKKK